MNKRKEITLTFLPQTVVWFLFLCILELKANEKKCPYHWFGKECQYICHCQGRCGLNGECEDGCEAGWFGLQCQYEDVARLAVSSAKNLTDGDDTTCNMNIQSLSATLKWNEDTPVTWMRLVMVKDFRNLEQLKNLSIQSYPINDFLSAKKTLHSVNTMDVHFKSAIIVRNLTLTGDVMPLICSVMLTGGRNVAVHQPTMQSSDYSDSRCDKSCSYAQNAVDGSTNDYLYAKSCTHTLPEKLPWWKINYTKLYKITKYLLFNRNVHAQRLKKFNIAIFGITELIYNYTDTGLIVKKVYTVIPPENLLETSVKNAVVTTMNDEKIISICEFESYGEIVCRNGTYGRDCEFQCKCRNRSESCQVSTGNCVSGCDDGYIGSGCSIGCPPTYYGQDCAKNCDLRCLNQLCNKVDGSCLQCLSGRTGNFCEKSCQVGTYGDGCSKNCSTYCDESGYCDPVTGACVGGCKTGFTGSLCLDKCDAGSYGSNCSLSCSPNCENGNSTLEDICHHFNGFCIHGCLPGYEGLQCAKACAATFYGQGCQQRCSENCLDHLCHNINGKCLSCPSGKFGDFCEQGDCLPPYYGVECKSICSINCVDQACNSTSGSCLDCPLGKRGDMCDLDCEATYFGQDCLQRCNSGCLDQLCVTSNGHCLKCPEFFTGTYCEINATAETEDKKMKVTTKCNFTDVQHISAAGSELKSEKIEQGGFHLGTVILAAFTGAAATCVLFVVIYFLRKFQLGSRYLMCLDTIKLGSGAKDQEIFSFHQDINED